MRADLRCRKPFCLAVPGKRVDLEQAPAELGVFEGRTVPGVTHGACLEHSSRLPRSYRDRADLDRQRLGLIG